MQDIVDGFFKADELSVDLFSCRCATAKECLKLPRHRCPKGCTLDTACFAANAKVLTEIYGRQEFNEKSDILDGDEAVGAYKVVVCSVDGFRASKRMRL